MPRLCSLCNSCYVPRERTMHTIAHARTGLHVCAVHTIARARTVLHVCSAVANAIRSRFHMYDISSYHVIRNRCCSIANSGSGVILGMIPSSAPRTLDGKAACRAFASKPQHYYHCHCLVYWLQLKDPRIFLWVHLRYIYQRNTAFEVV